MPVILATPEGKAGALQTLAWAFQRESAST